jgi:ubiquinone/menaquinone biosynthesis C-methylase UbiE
MLKMINMEESKMHKAAFWNRIAEKYAASPISDEAAYRRKLDLTQARMTPETEALEFGCGTGSTALIHAEHVKSYRATDFSDAMIEIAQSKVPVPENLKFEVAAFDEMPLDDASLDMVLGLSILHLVPDPMVTIAKAYRVLRPGGHFVTSTALLARFWPLKLIAPLGQAIGRLPQLSFFGADDLRGIMRDAGFAIEEDWQPDGGKTLFLIAQKAA